ncbi:hypothetical protein OROMI_014428 [Orobanche minor]
MDIYYPDETTTDTELMLVVMIILTALKKTQCFFPQALFHSKLQTWRILGTIYAHQDKEDDKRVGP